MRGRQAAMRQAAALVPGAGHLAPPVCARAGRNTIHGRAFHEPGTMIPCGAAMTHETALLATIAVSLGCAFLFGFIAARLRAPPLVGYLLAGVAVGPFTPGFVADARLASALAGRSEERRVGKEGRSRW